MDWVYLSFNCSDYFTHSNLTWPSSSIYNFEMFSMCSFSLLNNTGKKPVAELAVDFLLFISHHELDFLLDSFVDIVFNNVLCC